jgi:predicted ATP-dependent endonuclease of OLD family
MSRGAILESKGIAMKLSKVHIKEFKSIRDLNPFEIGNVTCLVGKNEAGKTAILEALYRLNPIIPEHAKFDVTDDYPRADVEEYQVAVEQKTRGHAIPISAVFTLEQEEMEPVEEEFGKGVFKTHTVTVSRAYASDNFYVDVDLDENVAVKTLVGEASLPQDVGDEARTQPSLKALSTFLERRAKEQQAAQSAAQAEAAAVVDAQEKAKAIDSASKLAESQAAKQLRAKLASLIEKPLGIHIWHEHLAAFFPKFLYFDEYYQMEGQVNIQQLKSRQAAKNLLDSDRPMLGLIDLARLNLDQLMAPQNTQSLINKLEGASNYLSKQIFKYWSQNQHISVKFDIRPGLPGDPEKMRDGTNLWGFVFDSAQLVTIRLGTRSRGFIWFFSFLAWFSQQRKSKQPMILLLDEPGLFLHASAQGDLLKYIEEELEPHHQVIYTSHSPFMIDPHHFERVRIVRNKSMETRDGGEPLPANQTGTKVLGDVLEADEGSLFPLQGALAYDITQTLFIGPNTVIIEGVSDMFYINAMTALLERGGRTGLSSKWTLSPVGGADKVPTFVALFRSQKGLNLATLIDLQKKDQQKVENLYKQKLLQKRQVLTFADFTKTGEADIEDMFDAPFYLELVNAEYKTSLVNPIKESDLPPHPRILVRLEKYLEANPLKDGVHFNHYRPARYFTEHADDLVAQLSANSLQRFEDAFKMLNTLLK